MKIEKLPPVDDFECKDFEFAGEEYYWIWPRMEGVKWTQENIIFRSSIWRKKDLTLVSGGFKKFFNWHQEPNIDPPVTRLNNHVEVIEKIDGSCLIASKINGQLLLRTRRAQATRHENYEELEQLALDNPKAFDNDMINGEDVSLLYEWTTPSNEIVLKYPKPGLTLIGAVYHSDYTYAPQWQLDAWAKEWNLPRPKVYTFKDLETLGTEVTAWEGKEGVCIYYGNGQRIRKWKSDWYNKVHNA